VRVKYSGVNPFGQRVELTLVDADTNTWELTVASHAAPYGPDPDKTRQFAYKPEGLKAFASYFAMEVA
jgi:hypothetical protein